MLLPAGANSTLVSLVSTDTLTNKTLTSPKINEDVAVTSTASEINVLDGITAVVGELNALDLGSTGTGTAIASKAVILDANKDYTGIRNLTTTGDVNVGDDFDVTGDAVIDGALLQTGVATFTDTPIANKGISVKNGATGPGFIEFFEDSDHGTNKVIVKAQAADASYSADVTLTLPIVTGTIATIAAAIDEATALAIALG